MIKSKLGGVAESLDKPCVYCSRSARSIYTVICKLCPVNNISHYITTNNLQSLYTGKRLLFFSGITCLPLNLEIRGSRLH